MQTKIKLLIIICAGIVSVNLIIPTLAHSDSSDVADNHNDMGGMMNFNFFSTPFMLMMIIGMGFQLLLAYWVYQDAFSKNLANPVLWAVVVLFTSIMGLIVYLLIAPNSKPYPSNSSNIRSNSSFNEKEVILNEQRNQRINYCKTCGAEVESESLYCSNCGTSIV